MTPAIPIIELYSIGTELVYGRIQDTNSFWMSQQIINLGGKVRRITQLTDDLEDIVAAFHASIERGADLVISSGGLGPTPDDLTTTAISRITGSPMVPRENVIADYMERRNIPSREDVSPNLIRMATVPACARVMLNPVGWAPCTCVEVDETTFLALPGPPREMEAVFARHVIPFISEHYEVKTATQRVLVNTYESDVAPLLQQLMEQYPGSYLKGFIALSERRGWLPVEIMVTGEHARDAQQMLQQIISSFRKMLLEKGQTLTVYPDAVEAES